MADERKLSDFRATRTVNDGWVVTRGTDVHETYAFRSDSDFLAALPGLIGATYVIPRFDLPGAPVQAFRAIDPSEVLDDPR